jgi:hypothetical protein
VDIKIGIKESPRELVISSGQSADEIEAGFAQASKDAGLFKLSDDKGRKFLIPVDQIAYVEIVPAEARKVGFTVGA